MKLLIKNMVSLRCKLIVKSLLESQQLRYSLLELGEVETLEVPTVQQIEKLKGDLLQYGLELLEDKKSKLIEKIKTIIIEMIHYSDEPPVLNFSSYLTEKLDYDYNYLSN